MGEVSRERLQQKNKCTVVQAPSNLKHIQSSLISLLNLFMKILYVSCRINMNNYLYRAVPTMSGCKKMYGFSQIMTYASHYRRFVAF